MNYEQRAILEMILGYYPEGKRQEVKDCVLEFAEKNSMANVAGVTDILLGIERTLMLAQLDEKPMNVEFKKLHDEYDKLRGKKTAPMVRNTKPFYTKFLNKHHKRRK